MSEATERAGCDLSAPGDTVTVECEGLGVLENRIAEGAHDILDEAGWMPESSDKALGVALGIQLRELSVSWDRMPFSAKESVYKAWFPLTRRRLGFEDASVDIDPINHTFTARLLVDGPVVNGALLTGFTGRWLVRDGLIATAIVIPRRADPAHA